MDSDKSMRRMHSKNDFYLKLQRNGEYIVSKYRDIVKYYTGFDLKFNIEFNGKVYICIFYLKGDDNVKTELHHNSVAYSVYNFFYEDGRKESVAMDVKSAIPGKRLGEIVFNLQLLLSIISGVEEVTLRNYTDLPERAIDGIYKLFDIDKRTYDRKNFTGKRKAEQIHESEGDMRYTLKSDSEKIWEENWNEIIMKLTDGRKKMLAKSKKRKRMGKKSKLKKHKKKKHTKHKKKQRRKSKMR